MDELFRPNTSCSHWNGLLTIKERGYIKKALHIILLTYLICGCKKESIEPTNNQVWATKLPSWASNATRGFVPVIYGEYVVVGVLPLFGSSGSFLKFDKATGEMVATAEGQYSHSFVPNDVHVWENKLLYTAPGISKIRVFDMETMSVADSFSISTAYLNPTLSGIGPLIYLSEPNTLIEMNIETKQKREIPVPLYISPINIEVQVNNHLDTILSFQNEGQTIIFNLTKMEEMYALQTPSGILNNRMVAGDKLVIWNGAIHYCFDTSTGQLLWERPQQEIFSGTDGVGILFSGDQSNRSGVDLLTGQTLWTNTDALNSGSSNGATFYQGGFYFAHFSFVGLSASTGEIFFDSGFEASNRAFSAPAVDPTNGKAYIATGLSIVCYQL